MIFGTENQTKSENPQKHAQSLAHLCTLRKQLLQYVKMVDKFAAAIVKGLSIDKLNAEQVFILAMLSLALVALYLMIPTG